MHVAYVSIGMSSTLFSSFELSRRLVHAGHRVSYLSHADIGSQVRAQGYDFVALEQDPQWERQASQVNVSWSDLRHAKRFLDHLRQRRAIRRRSMAAEELVQTVKHLAPDLLILDIELHVAIIATAALGIPTALGMVWFSVFRHPELPPLHLDLAPADSAARRFALRWAWWRLRLETLHMEWRQRLGRWWRAVKSPGALSTPIAYDTVTIDDVRAVARYHRFPYRDQTSRAHWLRPWVYTDLPILCFNGREMDFPHQTPASVHYVGPMVYRHRRPTAPELPSLDAWRAFSEHRVGSEEPAQGHRPLVYCSLGTYWSADVAFLGRVIEVFRGRPEWDLVLGLGGRLDPEDLAPLPSNVLALPFAPQTEVLQQADAAITHGGIGTINECLLHEVPMVVYSTKLVDQNGCAARLAYHGLGVLGDKDRDDVEALEGKVAKVLADQPLRDRTRAMAETLRAYELKQVDLDVLYAVAGQK